MVIRKKKGQKKKAVKNLERQKKRKVEFMRQTIWSRAVIWNKLLFQRFNP